MTLNPEVVLKRFHDAIEVKPSLDKLEVFLVNCILQKAIEKLLIIKELLQGPGKSEPSNYNSPAIRMKERKKFVPPSARLPDSVLISQKVKGQTSFLIDVFKETLTELEFQGSQVFLEYTLCCGNLTLFDNQTIVQENMDYKKLTNYLQEKLKDYNQNNQQTQHLLESTGPCLDQAVVNVYGEENLGAIYACMREVTRTEKNALELKENELAVQQLNKKFDSEIVEENLIHQEINTHLALLLAELTDKVEYWTNKYNTEINQVDIDLLQIKNQKDELTTALETQLQKFAEMKIIKEALEDESGRREREFEQTILDNKAATKIQKWWRNILFQRRVHKKGRTKLSKSSVTKHTTKKKTRK